MPASILKWKVEEYGAAREQPWLDRAAHRRCRWVTNRSASRCHQQNAETASMIIPQRGKFENRPLGPTIPQSINLLQHCQNPTPRVAAATFRHPFPEGKSYELFLSMFTLVPTNLHLVTLLPGGRQTAPYSPELEPDIAAPHAPDSSFEAVCAEGAVREVSASTHTHASGVFASPVVTQAQVR
jgi:hypothetical protein